MFKKLLLVLFIAVLGLSAVLLYNTFRFPSAPAPRQALQISGINDSAALHLSEALQIKTVSFGDTLAIDTAEFVKIRSFLESTYPAVHTQLPRMIFSEFSYVFTWKGKDTTLAPYVLMAHMDVVPVEAVAESKWSVPSFSGKILKDTIWGRGAVDDKASVIGIFEAVEQLLKENFQPQRTIYLCFGHDEEITGRRGAAKIAQWFKENNIKPQLVVDEGGMVDTEKFKKSGRPVAVIGVGEKGYCNIDLTVEIPGGHSSMPVQETAIDVLNKAIAKIRAQQMPGRITPPVQEMLGRIAAIDEFTTKLGVSNQWLLSGSIISMMEKDKQTNAMVHTTLVPTIVKAGIKDNVIPTVAKATFNSRILPGETSDDVVAFVKKVVNDDRVQVKKQTISLFEPSATTSTSHPMFLKVEEAVYKTVPNVHVTPYLIVGATDSRYFRPFSDAVLNFAPMRDAKGFHGIDERIAVSDLKDMIFFYRLLVTEK
ncbi:M20/M25/M40 family metallo-hydrolase [Lacibacter sp. MH-610]|uniref:M20/M25/M40 family metallo-hydrolase n=1 Tax=Lacibacter sp. MH-610 TaxID=3020883 RepID=UPI0038919207